MVQTYDQLCSKLISFFFWRNKWIGATWSYFMFFFTIWTTYNKLTQFKGYDKKWIRPKYRKNKEAHKAYWDRITGPIAQQLQSYWPFWRSWLKIEVENRFILFYFILVNKNRLYLNKRMAILDGKKWYTKPEIHIKNTSPHGRKSILKNQ